MTDAQRFAAWGSDIMTIHADVKDAVVRRAIYRETVKIVNANPSLHRDSAFWEWMGAAHVETTLMAVRRQIDRDKRSVSLRNLLAKIQKHPQALSRQNVLAMLAPEARAFGSERFDLFIGPGAAHADPQVVAADVAALDQQTDIVRHYANKRVAHRDQQGPTTLPTFKDLDDALDVIWGLLKRYFAVLRCLEFAGDPEIPGDWKEIFREPWMP